MTDFVALALSVLFLMLVIIVTGRRRGEPAWVIAGYVAGGILLSIGVIWAASIGQDAFWAAMVVAIGIGLWGQIEFLWWRRRGGK